MDFSTIIANQQCVDEAKRLVNGDHVPHALLLTGPSGTSKLPIALAMASYILCENKNNGEICGTCRACMKTNKLVHPDLHFSFPFIGSKNTSDDFITQFRKFILANPYGSFEQWIHELNAENKQPNINTKECRNIIRKLSYKTYESDSKVLIIWMPEYLRKEGNRLLKLIEEPTDSTYIILVADKTEQLLPTIVSRCQIIKIKKPSDQYINEVLVNQFGVNQTEAEELTFLAEGNIVKALSLVDKKTVGLHEDILHWFRICYSMKSTEMVDWVEVFSKKNKEDIKTFFQYALNFLREVARIPILSKNLIRLNEKEYETAKKMSAIVTFDEIEELSRVLSENFYFVERNANIKILMMDTSITFTKILRQANKTSN